MNSNVEALVRTDGRVRERLIAYLELMKPELTGLSVLTALCGFYLAVPGPLNYWLFLHTALGTLLVGGGAGALNQYIERRYDALMKRTERRPLPSGRVVPAEALVFGSLISLFGILDLALFTNPLTGFLGALTWATYLFLYTPLKRVTPFSTIIGGLPGAIPPMMGWAAVRNELTPEAWILFAILFCWQMPHFFSLAWMYRRDYARAGFKMLTVLDEHGIRTSNQVLLYSLMLLPASIAPAVIGMTGTLSVAAAILLGSGFLVYGSLLSRAARRWRRQLPGGPADSAAARLTYYSRRLFFASLLYLPALMIVLSLDKL